ncbi:MAG: SagB/ThcOx family dehydrogenase [Paludibacteraceae bacterium]
MKKLYLLLLVFPFALNAENIKLPTPVKNGGKPLMEALNARQSTRVFSEKELSANTLSNLLWAAFGYNRTDKRTAPSAMNKKSIDIYVATKNGIYLYDAKQNGLQMKVKGDYRKQTGMQPFVGSAFMEIVYVAKNVSDNNEMLYADCGFIAQNVYLYCASENLGTMVRGSVPKEKLAKILGLSDKKQILLCQTVGYKKN